MIPIFLEGYAPLAELARWKAESSPYATGRSWEIRSWGARSGATCRLCWNLKGQVAGLDRTATSVEESVYLVLEEFTRLEKLS